MRSRCGRPKFSRSSWWRVESADAWQLEHMEAYRDVLRLGRKTRLSEDQRTRSGQSLKKFALLKHKILDLRVHV